MRFSLSCCQADIFLLKSITAHYSVNILFLFSYYMRRQIITNPDINLEFYDGFASSHDFEETKSGSFVPSKLSSVKSNSMLPAISILKTHQDIVLIFVDFCTEKSKKCELFGVKFLVVC